MHSLTLLLPWTATLPAGALIKAIGAPSVPPGGWTSATFAKDGERLVKAIYRAFKATTRQVQPTVQRMAQGLFRGQMEEMFALWAGAPRFRAAQDDLDATASLMMAALEKVIAESQDDAIKSLIPPVQAVVEEAYSKVGIMLGGHGRVDWTHHTDKISKDIARRITRLDDTTRAYVRDQITKGIAERLTVTELTKRLREKMPQWSANRAFTVARTETTNAWTAGSVASFQECKTLTHVSVIGCEAREPRSPQYRGESTCNIQDVPVQDANLLEFHPNHTGCMVPSQFQAVAVTRADLVTDPEAEAAPNPDAHLTDEQRNALRKLDLITNSRGNVDLTANGGFREWVMDAIDIDAKEIASYGYTATLPIDRCLVKLGNEAVNTDTVRAFIRDPKLANTAAHRAAKTHLPVIAKDKDNGYYIVDGHARLLAARLRGEKDVKVTLVSTFKVKGERVNKAVLDQLKGQPEMKAAWNSIPASLRYHAHPDLKITLQSKPGSHYNYHNRELVIGTDWGCRDLMLIHEFGHHFHFELDLCKHFKMANEPAEVFKKVQQRVKNKLKTSTFYSAVVNDIKNTPGFESFNDNNERQRYDMTAYTDTAAAASEGAFGFGHSKNYWKTSTYAGPMEFMAHVMEATSGQFPILDHFLPRLKRYGAKLVKRYNAWL